MEAAPASGEPRDRSASGVRDVFIELVGQALADGPPLSAAACALLDELSGLHAAAQIATMRRLAAEGFTRETVQAILGLALGRARDLPAVSFETFDAPRVAEQVDELLRENVGPMLGRVIEIDEVAAEPVEGGRSRITVRYRWAGTGEVDSLVAEVGG